jgi:Domain of unknown function (DUF222)
MASPAESFAPDGPDESAARDESWSTFDGGLSWCWDFDLAALLDAVSGPAPWRRAAAAASDAAPPASDAAPPASDAAPPASDAAPPASDGATAASDGAADDPEAEAAAYQEAVAAGRVREVPLEWVAGRIAESLPTGPGLAGWLAQPRAAGLEDGALAGIAASFRRLASWAAAGELAAVAQIASRSAKTDRRAEVDEAGRPDRVTADAAGQVALALAMSHDGATSWADLGVMLTWRLPATGAALAAGEIDLGRARMIVRMTSALSDEAARQVEAAVLSRAGWMTLGQLHAALRRAVIKADPEGAERRRKQAERNASVAFYPEDEGTATLAGYSLPGVEAAAAMARIYSLAKAMKAAGSTDQMDLLCAHVFLGLLLGTLPFTPPADTLPPDTPPPGPRAPGSPADAPPGSPADASPADSSAPPAPDVPEGGTAVPPGLSAGFPGLPAGSPGPWPGIRPYLPSWLPNTAGQSSVTGPRGLLNLAVPLATLTGTSSAPGQLSRLGVVTASQARQLAVLAGRHPATRWRVVIANAAGQAIAVRHVPRSRSPGNNEGLGLIGRVTLVVRADELAHGPPPGPAANDHTTDGALAVIINRAIVAAARAAEMAMEREERDHRSGGCAHDLASPAYRPPPRVAELVTARDGTCRFPPCRRPAEQCDLDHTRPFDQGGLTCSCNLGGECRSHHQLKQHPRWSLRQLADGVFHWMTPAGRSYVSRPDPYCL